VCVCVCVREREREIMCVYFGALGALGCALMWRCVVVLLGEGDRGLNPKPYPQTPNLKP
jgi:hypothetical protein